MKNAPIAVDFIQNLPQSSNPRIVIIGGGFAGLKLARKLAHKPYQIVLLDKNNYHQFQPLFYQVATSGLEPSAISFPLRKIFHKTSNVHFRMAEALSVDSTAQILFTSVGKISYDYLVIAAGADTNYFGIENIRKNAIPMKSVSEALYIRNRIIANYEEALNTLTDDAAEEMMNVVIVGGGPTGVELAGALAEMKKSVLPKDYPELNFDLMEVYLIEASSQLLNGMSEASSEKAKEYLTRLGVNVMTKAQVVDYDGQKVSFKNHAPIFTKTLLWAAGIKANHLEGLEEASYTKGGRLITDRFNRVSSYQNIFALGDVAYMSTEKYPNGHPQVAQVAIQQAKNLADNLLLWRKNNDVSSGEKFVYKDLGSMATVGRKLAVVDLPIIHFNGFFAWITWLFIHLMAIVGVKNKVFIFLDWAWNYLSFDPSLRLLIRPRKVKQEEVSELLEPIKNPS
ncbi:NAD(P)/FAD-dependent oxidoreductase [Penaeicola halotolerans]|uniref:NAD(P)/FAD-dependent oxidoreductase n=1 Tax=Penaeicola halotolerans TaxID=2793196 RepID=UPI001CF929A5|nr:NAD(P)/FAD-dependent oxidoreductase [Penaeicola halotolerans]